MLRSASLVGKAVFSTSLNAAGAETRSRPSAANNEWFLYSLMESFCPEPADNDRLDVIKRNILGQCNHRKLNQ